MSNTGNAHQGGPGDFAFLSWARPAFRWRATVRILSRACNARCKGVWKIFGPGLVACDRSGVLPVRMDVKEDEAAYHVTADLPGLSENEVDATFDDGLLTIRGEKKVTREDKQDTWHIVERSHGSFARQLSLPANIAVDKIEANFDKGVLKMTLPKAPAERAAAKKIEIKAG